MSRFQILPIDPTGSLAAVLVRNEAQILPAVQRLEWPEADVLKDGEYSFSVRLGENGAWCIFKRDLSERAEVTSTAH